MINRFSKTQSLRMTLSGRNPNLTSSSAFCSLNCHMLHLALFQFIAKIFFLHVNIKKKKVMVM